MKQVLRTLEKLVGEISKHEEFEKYSASIILGSRDLENSWNGDSRPERLGKNSRAMKQVLQVLESM
jgi:hypothetical protein